MCVTKGESPDTKQRCGVAQGPNNDGLESIRVSCFNCGFSSQYILGRMFSERFKSFLSQLGMQELEINQINHRAFQLARVFGQDLPIVNPNRYVARFPTVSLPPDTRPMSEVSLDNEDAIRASQYARDRGDIIYDNAMWSPDPKWRKRVIFPCYWNDEIVGWTGRLFEPQGDQPKYRNEVPANYLSNCNMMNSDRKYLLLTEGFLDAIAVDGISPLGAKLNANQIKWIRDTGKDVIVIPDRDQSGQRLVDIAIENDWRVAFPRLTLGGNNWWEEDCKDSAEAVKRYGRLYTIRSIIETSTDRKLEIEVRRKWLY